MCTFIIIYFVDFHNRSTSKLQKVLLFSAIKNFKNLNNHSSLIKQRGKMAKEKPTKGEVNTEPNMEENEEIEPEEDMEEEFSEEEESEEPEEDTLEDL